MASGASAAEEENIRSIATTSTCCGRTRWRRRSPLGPGFRIGRDHVNRDRGQAGGQRARAYVAWRGITWSNMALELNSSTAERLISRARPEVWRGRAACSILCSEQRAGDRSLVPTEVLVVLTVVVLVGFGGEGVGKKSCASLFAPVPIICRRWNSERHLRICAHEAPRWLPSESATFQGTVRRHSATSHNGGYGPARRRRSAAGKGRGAGPARVPRMSRRCAEP